MEYARKNILVTGGAGFIGSFVVDELASRNPASVHVVDNLFLGREENLADARRVFAGVRFHHMDATDGPALRELIRRNKIEVVFNLATKALGHSFVDPLDAFHVNVQIAGHLLESLRSGETMRLIHFSSSEAYGTARELPMSEKHPLLPHTLYAAGKAAADLMIHSYQESFGLRVLTIRPFNNYGPRQNEGLYAGVIPITMSRILRGEPPVIQGTGEQTRDFVFVKETARLAVEMGIQDELMGRVVNLGTGQEIAIRELVHRICLISGYLGPVRMEPARMGDVLRHCADTSEMRRLGFEPPPRMMDENLRETWEWYRSRLIQKKQG